MVESTQQTTHISLPEGSVVRFVGDLHLGDGGSNDTFGGRDKVLADFLDSCVGRCDAVVFMGDALDVPQSWTAARILRAHPLACAAITDLCEQQTVCFIRGNHDWTVDYTDIFPQSRVCETVSVGGVLAMHGHQLDRYCHPERRGHRPAIVLHHLAERLFGFHFRLPLHEHDTWQNRIAHRLGSALGHHLRRSAPLYRRLGWHGRAAGNEAFIHYWSRALWGDPHALFEPVCEFLSSHDQTALVCGHTHLPGVVSVQGRVYMNVGSWTFGGAQFGEVDGVGFTVADHATGQVFDDKSYRWMLAGHDPGDFFTWWSRHYRGWLRFADPMLLVTESETSPG